MAGDDPADTLARRAFRHAGLIALALLVLAVGAGLVTFLLRPAPGRHPEDSYVPPRGYVCYRAPGPITVDGKLDDRAWDAAPWTDDFVDIEGDVRPPPRFRTRVKMLWDDTHFYIAARMEEPHVWATLTRHDSVIFQENNDFEVFLDPDGDSHNYGELELNALNTTWDLFLPRPYKDGGKADDGWEIEGLRTAVHVDGTLNDPRDVDRGWSVEIAIPFHALGRLTRARPPRDGEQWRVNFSRVEWRHQVVGGKYTKVEGVREDNWVWSPQGVIDMHRPERWGYVQFSTAPPGSAAFRPDPAGPARHLLHRVYYAQRDFHKDHKRYARTLAELGLAGLHHDSLAGPPGLEAQADSFEAHADVRLDNGAVRRWHIRQDARVWASEP